MSAAFALASPGYHYGVEWGRNFMRAMTAACWAMTQLTDTITVTTVLTIENPMMVCYTALCGARHTQPYPSSSCGPDP